MSKRSSRLWTNISRLIAVILVAFVPVVALADDPTTPVDPNPAATTSSDASSQTGQGSAGSGLGPQTNNAPTGSSGAGPSNADASALQPAGTSMPLQSTTGASTGLAAPASDTLQAPSTNTDQLRVLLDAEADGGRHQTGETAPTWPYLVAIAAGLALLAGIGWLVYRRWHMLSQHAGSSLQVPAETPAASAPEPHPQVEPTPDPENEPEPHSESNPEAQSETEPEPKTESEAQPATDSASPDETSPKLTDPPAQ